MKNRFLRGIKHFGLFMQANFRNALQLRASFWLDVLGMAINNVAFIIIWIFFFNTMGTINGWGSIEAIGLDAMVGLTYGITFAFAGGASTLAMSVNTGNFDNYLLSPVNLYLRVLTSYSRTSAFGDMIYGIVLLIIFVILAKLPFFSILLLVAMIPLSSLIMINFLLVSSLVAFLIPDTAEVASNLFELMISPSLYPSGLFSKTMHFIFLFIVPAIAIAGAPVELIRHPSWGLFGTILALSIFWTWLAMFLLKKALRHYESGNLTGFKG